MKNFKLSSKFYLFIPFFAAVGFLAVHMGFSMLFDGLTMEEGGEGIVLPVAFAIAGVTYLIVAVTMILQLVFYKGSGLKMNEEGIHDTFVLTNIFAFFFAMPVKFIPWDAVIAFDEEKGYMVAYLDTSKVNAGGLAKSLLKLGGYRFCGPFVEPAVTEEDIKEFREV